jgi:hypothetical protein
MESGIVVQSAPLERWQIALEGKHPDEGTTEPEDTPKPGTDIGHGNARDA